MYFLWFFYFNFYVWDSSHATLPGCDIIYFMAKKTASTRNSDRPNGKAFKKHPKKFDPIKRRLVTA
jgi:hypothetical protein